MRITAIYESYKLISAVYGFSRPCSGLLSASLSPLTCERLRTRRCDSRDSGDPNITLASIMRTINARMASFRLFWFAFLFLSTTGYSIPLNTIRNDGVILNNGVPIFPFGFYHDQFDNSTLVTTALPAIYGAGFDLVCPEIDENNGADISTIFSTSASAGAHVISNIYWPGGTSYVNNLVNSNKTSPASLAWGLADDTNYPPLSPHFSPTTLSARNAQIHANAPSNLTYASFITDSASIAGATFPPSSYAGSVDIVGIENYPIAEGNSTQAEELEYGAQTMINCRKAFSGTSTTYFDLPQTFSWGTRWPTNAESRNMLYVSLIYGAKGILCYSYYEVGVGYLRTGQPTLWNYYSLTLLPEVKAMATQFLLTGTLVNPPGLPSHIHCGIWTTSQNKYVIVANTSPSSTTSVTIPVPGTTGGAMSEFLGEPSGLRLTNGVLTGNVSPRDVHVYSISLAGLSAPLISNIQASSVTATTADISWNVSPNCTGQVEYGKTTSYGSFTTLESNLLSFNKQHVSGLHASTLYHYRIHGTDAAGSTVALVDRTFTTTH